jgi:hypothetical protein
LEHLQLKLLLLIKSTITFVVLATFLYSLTSTHNSSLQNKTLEAADSRVELHSTLVAQTEQVVYQASLPTEPIKPRDNRAILLESFLRGKGSYLADYTDLIVEQSDYYGVNPRVLIAISGAESSYCKVNFRPHNCWGYGKVGWATPEDSIRGYMAMMNAGYFSRGARTIEGIASPYNPHPVEYTQKVYMHYNQMPQV